MTREVVFECTYASPAQRLTAYVRAWSAHEAVELFADELRADGIADRGGSISVRARGEGSPPAAVYHLG